jgi:hypothetical protein
MQYNLKNVNLDFEKEFHKRVIINNSSIYLTKKDVFLILAKIINKINILNNATPLYSQTIKYKKRTYKIYVCQTFYTTKINIKQPKKRKCNLMKTD